MMNFILPLALLAIWIENSNAFSMHSRLRVLSRNFEQHEKPHTKPDMPTNNIFKAYVQNRMLMQPAEPIESEPMLPMVNKIAQVADMRKATSVVALRVSHLTEITQFMVLVEASNSRQIQAISDTVEVMVVVTHKILFLSI